MESRFRNLSQVYENLRNVQQKERQAHQRWTETQGLVRFWEALDSHLKNGRPGAALLVLSEEYPRVLETSAFDQVWSRLIDETRLECEEAATQTIKGFGRTFPDAVRESNIEIDSTSRHPRYTVYQGFIQIYVNDRAYTVTITPRDGTMIKLGLDVAPIVERLKEEIDRLFNRRFEPTAFLSTLFRAYSSVIRAERRQDGDQVPIRRVTNRLSKNLNRFSPDEFNVDLAKLLRTSESEIDGRVMRLNHTRHPRQGMLLQGLEEGGYIGFISFNKEDRE